jgi:hypothetical protein
MHLGEMPSGIHRIGGKTARLVEASRNFLFVMSKDIFGFLQAPGPTTGSCHAGVWLSALPVFPLLDFVSFLSLVTRYCPCDFRSQQFD